MLVAPARHLTFGCLVSFEGSPVKGGPDRNGLFFISRFRPHGLGHDVSWFLLPGYLPVLFWARCIGSSRSLAVLISTRLEGKANDLLCRD